MTSMFYIQYLNFVNYFVYIIIGFALKVLVLIAMVQEKISASTIYF